MKLFHAEQELWQFNCLSSAPSTSKDLQIEVLGGELNVSFQSPNNGKVENIWLTGPATFVFEGYIHI